MKMLKNTIFTMSLMTVSLMLPMTEAQAKYTPQQACASTSAKIGGNARSSSNWKILPSEPNRGGPNPLVISYYLNPDLPKPIIQLAHVYLLWSSKTGENCVATIKDYYYGTRTYTRADLIVRVSRATYLTSIDPDKYREYLYYAATIQRSAGKCVKFSGSTKYLNGLYAKSSNWGWCN